MVNKEKRFETIYTQGISWNIVVDIETGYCLIAVQFHLPSRPVGRLRLLRWPFERVENIS